MKSSGFARAVIVGALSVASSIAGAQIKVGVIYSSTGPLALIGQAQRDSVALLPKEMGGQKVEYISLDDASDPTASVSAIKKLINEERVDAIIGPSGSPNAMAVIQFAAEAGVPVFAPVGSAAVVLPMDDRKRWVFKTTQNDDLIARALVDHMAKQGVRTVGFIGTADPLGENWLKVFGELAGKFGVKIVSTESFQRRDTSVTAQSLKTIAARPDAVLIVAPGGPAVLPQATLRDQGYRGPIYQTHGAALDEFLKLGGRKVEGTLLAASGMLVLDELPASHPTKVPATQYVQGFEKLYGHRPATFGASVQDAGLLLQGAVPAALKKGRPGTPAFRAALRDAVEQTKDLPGVQGVYSMSPQDHSGFDERGRMMITVRDGKWALLK